MPDQIQIRSRDYWVKDDVWLTWVLVDPAGDGTVHAYFINEASENETSQIFAELTFPSAEAALEALQRNRFRRYAEKTYMQSSSYFRPPSPPFRRTTLHPNLLYSIFWTDSPVSEANVLQTIATMIEKYEPGLKLEGAFTNGVRGRADPQYFATRAERFRRLAVKNGLSVSFMEAGTDVMHDATSADGAEADPRINWRLTACHGDYYIHIMALDQALSRFACCLQTSTEFEEGLVSEHRSRCTLYKTGNLAEIAKILDEIYATIKRQDEQRCKQDEQRREQDRLDAIERERKIRQERLESAERRRRKLICALVCIIVVFLIGYASSQEWISKETGLTLIIATILLVVGWYGFNEQQKKIREYSRAIDEQNERKAKAEEKYRIYEENYQREEKALRKRVLDDLKAVARRDKRRLDSEAVEAAKKIMERQGVNNPGMAEKHPEIVKLWTALIDDLSAETLEDAKGIQDRLADLLYPETLEDVEALRSLQSEGLKKFSLGKKPNAEHLDAAKALNEIWARDMRRRIEEEEAEERERARKRKQEKEQATLVDEMMKRSAKNIARMYGLPENAFEGMRPEEVAMHARFLRLSHKFAHLPAEEQKARTLEELERELDQERQERRRRME
jgi:hypothetical protein